jgi:predicted DNA-binding WGR domain protein
MTPGTDIIRSTTLYFREGSSDKIYQANIEAADGGHVVNFAYGRRGSTMNTGTKTPAPVSLAEAVGIHDKLVASKLAKGYTPGEDGTPVQRVRLAPGGPRHRHQAATRQRHQNRSGPSRHRLPVVSSSSRPRPLSRARRTGRSAASRCG